MKTETLTKLSTLTSKVLHLKHKIKSVEEGITDIKETNSFYSESSVLIFERQISSPSADQMYSSLNMFTSLLDNPQYYDGYNVYEGECLLIDLSRIDSEIGEDCEVKVVYKMEPVAWEDYDEENTYLQVWHEAKPTEEQCSKEVERLEKELCGLREEVNIKEREIKALIKEK